MNAWPFLVSRNQYIDYQTVVAPDFICKAGISNILARTTEGDLTEPGNAFIRKIEGSKAGSFTIVFQVVEANEKDINPEGGNTLLTDFVGREISLIKGFILKGKQNPRDIEIYQRHIDKSYEYSVESYREFWEKTDSKSKITSSKAFLLEGEKNTKPLRLIELPSFEVEPHIVPINFNLRVGVAIIMALFFIFGIIFTSWSLQFFSKQQKNHEIVSIYNKNEKYKLISLQITGEMASDGSDASGCYWIIDKEEANFIVTNDGKSIYKTGEQIIASDLKIKVDNTVSASTKRKKITLKDENVSKKLKKLQKEYKNAAIYISGSLQVNSPDKITKLIDIKHGQYKTLSIYDSNLLISYYPIEQAIIKLQNQVLTGTITLRIIQPKPKFGVASIQDNKQICIT